MDGDIRRDLVLPLSDRRLLEPKIGWLAISVA
jgi:hypothetical protein